MLVADVVVVLMGWLACVLSCDLHVSSKSGVGGVMGHMKAALHVVCHLKRSELNGKEGKAYINKSNAPTFSVCPGKCTHMLGALNGTDAADVSVNTLRQSCRHVNDTFIKKNTKQKCLTS